MVASNLKIENKIWKEAKKQYQVFWKCRFYILESPTFEYSVKNRM